MSWLAWIGLGVSVSTDHDIVAARTEHDPGERDPILSIRSTVAHSITFRFSLPDVFQVFLCSGRNYRLGSTPEAIDEGLPLDWDSVTILHLGRILHCHYRFLSEPPVVSLSYSSLRRLKSTLFQSTRPSILLKR